MKDGSVQFYGLMKKRIMTTMIGAIARLEKYIDLFEEDEYESLRKEILDNGNRQLKEMEKDLEHFEVRHKTYYFMPLRRNNGQVRD